MSKFGSLLVQDGVVGVSQIEHALQHQVLYGGDLATNLLELSIADEETLTHYAARALGMTALSPKQLEAPGKRALERFPSELAKTFKMIPIRLIGNQLLAAISGPWARETLDEVAALARLDEIVPQFVLSFRMAMALNRYYGVAIPPRERLLQQRLAPEFVPDLPPIVNSGSEHSESKSTPGSREKAAPKPESGLAAADKKQTAALSDLDPEDETSDLVVASQGRRKKRDDSTTRVYTPERNTRSKTSPNLPRVVPLPAPKTVLDRQKPVKEEDDHPSTPPPAPSALSFISRPPARHQEAAFDFVEAKKRLDEAESRDDILRLLIEYGNAVFEFVIVFVVHGTTAQGRDGCLYGESISGVGDITIPLDQGGMFGTVYETKSYHLGPLAINEVTEEAFRVMQRDWPQNCALLTVALRHRVILMIYGDRGQEAIPSEAMSDYVRFVGIVGGAFERILLKQKYGGRPAVPSFAPKGPLGLEDEQLQSWAGRYHLHTDNLVSDLSENASPDLKKATMGQLPVGAERSEAKTGLPHTSPAQTVKKIPIAVPKPPSTSPPAPVPRNADSWDSIPVPVSSESSPPSYPIAESELRPSSPMLPEEIAQRQARRRRRPTYEGSTSGVFKAQVVNVNASAGRSIVVNMDEEIDRLVERVLNPEPYDETAAELLLGIGVDALQKLVRQFPGPLVIDRYQQSGRLRRIQHHGPLLKTVLKFGKKAVPFLLPLFDSVDSDVRFYVTFLFSELHYPEALEKLTTRLFDSDRQIRAIATDVIRGYKRHPEYRWAIEKVIGTMQDKRAAVESKRFAAEALGLLREPSAVIGLADNLTSNDPVLVERSVRALVRITFCNYGSSRDRWLEWWYANRARHRIEWAMDALINSQETLRKDAAYELKTLIGDVVTWPSDPADIKQCAELRRNLSGWWEREGRELNPQKEN